MSARTDGDVNTLNENDDDVKAPPTKKPFLTSAEIKELSRDEIITRFSGIEKYITTLEGKCESVDSGANSDIEEKLKLQQQESTRRENVLVMRLATKEQEMQELLTQIHELKQSQNPSTSQLKSTLLDPSVNLLFEKMKTELGDAKGKLEQAQNDLSAWKFTSDSVTGKKLMAKCRMLIAENQDLGKQLSQGRIAQLEAELALQKKYNDELKCSQDELNDFVLQLDEEVEGMESTICALQQQLKETKQKYQNSQEEVTKLKSRFENIDSITTFNEEQMTDASRNDLVSKQAMFQTIESRNKRALRDLGTNYSETEDVYDAIVRTKSTFHSEEDSTSAQESPTNSNIKGPFSISKLLSPDKVKPEYQWTVRDNDPDVDVNKSERYHGKSGTNGGYVDSDSNTSS